MTTLQLLTEKHSLISETTFRFKSFFLILRRQLQNLFASIKTFTDNGELQSEQIIAVSESDLWNTDDNEQNWILTAGKVQNLRLAAKRLHGIEVEANEVFSFWQHLGNPNIGRGYVVGREIKEGCIVPTVAGGICQLSNALYDAALKADFEIIERHRHTKVIKGSLAEQDRDATVKWNYIDLRFKSRYPFRIEIELTAEKLMVRFRSKEKEATIGEVVPPILQQTAKLNDCYSCGNFQCFKHQNRTSSKQEKAITAFILDDKWSEFDTYIQSNSTDKDFFIVPLKKNSFFRAKRYDWTIHNPAKAKSVPFAAINRALRLRLLSKKRNNVFSHSLQLDKKVAKAAAKEIPIECTHIVTSQSLLPFLWEEGVLGGRTFDVLMNRLPMEKLHQRLDFALQKFPESTTLNDFRASQKLIELENTALTKSRHIITPHKEIADIFNNKSIKLEWTLPKVHHKKTEGKKILFPASTLARKGAYEMKRLAMELHLYIVYTGQATETKNFWRGVNAEPATTHTFDNICVVVYPAYIEHQPRQLLRAISAGIPVITTTACGLSAAENVRILQIGDYEALKRAVEQII